ncbi:MAG: hypothetical protein P4K86_04155 [Terracidiphilus sp.]|nr:hypothetical protein [Terracidiphilus sp.]
MQTDRRILLHLVALGRITPAEAERLLTVWNQGRENLWALSGAVLIACLALLRLPELLPSLVHVAHSLWVGNLNFLRHALSLFTQLLGGLS